MSKELLNTAIIQASEERPNDFRKTMEKVTSDKLSVKLTDLVKQKEKEIINKYK